MCFASAVSFDEGRQPVTSVDGVRCGACVSSFVSLGPGRRRGSPRGHYMVPCQELADPEARASVRKRGPAPKENAANKPEKRFSGGAPVGAALFHKKSAY